jgi:hypothetical protein
MALAIVAFPKNPLYLPNFLFVVMCAILCLSQALKAHIIRASLESIVY